jgi:putative ABC transport system permease protein
MATTSAPNPQMDSSTESFDSTLKSAHTTMVFGEVVSLAIDSFRAGKARFLLTMLGMIIGSASIILTVVVGQTGKKYALDAISSLGQNKIEMQYAGGSVIGPDNTAQPDNMTRDDMQYVVDNVPGIIAYSPMLEDHEMVSMGDGTSKECMLLGVSAQYKDVRGLVTVAGRFFDEQDAAAHAKVTVLNLPLAVKLYGSPQAAVDQEITIKSVQLRIVGVFRESIDTYGQSEISDDALLIPYEVARYFTGKNDLKEIFFRVKDTSMVEPDAKLITDLITSRHRPGSVYRPQTLTGILKTAGDISNDLTWMLILAAVITLVVSGVGIMNSMLANVTARIREIGIRKALGATRREIRLQFLTEAVFLSLSGGLVGTLLGVSVPLLINFLMPPGLKIPVDITLVYASAIALVTSMLVGVIFGTVPANRAAALDPVETLKYE